MMQKQHTHATQHNNNSIGCHQQIELFSCGIIIYVSTMIGVVLLSALLPVYSAKVPLTMLSDYPQAKCLDGTNAGFYAQLAPNPEDSLRWVIYLDGGGECDTEDACVYQTESALGSSKYFANESDPSGWYLASDYCPYNPTFCGWNHVKDPYCTQDLHSGQVTEATDATWGLYFSGHLVLEATLNALDKPPYNLVDATDIIVSGASAGGIGVWMNVDYIKNRYPKAHVTAATIAGHYFYASYYEGENHTESGGMADFRESAWPTTYALYDAYVDESCKEAFEAASMSPAACMLSNNSFPYIESDSFVIQSQTDR
jgi:O-palmitoleoyl-L-serine hydrolase